MPKVKSRAIEITNGSINISEFGSTTIKSALLTVHTPKKTVAIWVSEKELSDLGDIIFEYLKS